MDTQVLGVIPLDEKRLSADIVQLSDHDFNDTYNEYVYGNWKTCPLWNETGDSKDSFTRIFTSQAKKTSFMDKMPYLHDVIVGNFNIKRLRSARLFKISKDSFLIPHRDFIELEEPMLRIHLPLVTSEKCYHSEEDMMFHMKASEVWYLDAMKIHSVGCFDDINRIHLVMDFAFDDDLSSIYSNKQNSHNVVRKPERLRRPKFSSSDLRAVLGLSRIINKNNFRQILGILSSFHFFRDVAAGEAFNWLAQIVAKHDDPSVIEKARIITQECIKEREHVRELTSLVI